MKKLMLILIVAVSFAFAESCVINQKAKAPAEEVEYSYRELCIDEDLYTADFRPSEKDFVNLQPAIVYRDGKPVQKKCICAKYDMIEQVVPATK